MSTLLGDLNQALHRFNLARAGRPVSSPHDVDETTARLVEACRAIAERGDVK